MIADGGGLAAAVRVPIHGIDAVAKLLARAEQAPYTLESRPVWLNGAPAIRVEFDGAAHLADTSPSLLCGEIDEPLEGADQVAQTSGTQDVASETHRRGTDLAGEQVVEQRDAHLE